MDEKDLLAGEFETHRTHLRAVAYRMLGSLTEADDAVQESWLRLNRTDTSDVENLAGWLTTVVARVCLDMLRSRRARRAEPLDGDPGADTDTGYVHLPDPIIGPEGDGDPEHQALLADSVGLALLVVLETLPPAERLAFVLHDMFAVSFDEIAPLVGRTPTAARKLASRARHRVRGSAPVPDADLARQRQVVDAFFAAAHGGDFDALVAVLDPDVVLRSDAGALREGSVVLHGAQAVAKQAFMFRRLSPFVRPALVNGVAGVVVAPGGRLRSVMGFTVVDGKIVAIDALADPDRLEGIDLTVLDDA
jgi:RNA polymerase sigma factor (sigma-70 family)